MVEFALTLIFQTASEQVSNEVKDLKTELEQSKLEIESLQSQLQKAKQHVEQYKTIADSVQQTMKEQTEVRVSVLYYQHSKEEAFWKHCGERRKWKSKPA